MEVGSQVKFQLEGQTFVGKIAKAYTNSFLIEFESNDAEIIDKYHDKVIISQKQVEAAK